MTDLTVNLRTRATVVLTPRERADVIGNWADVQGPMSVVLIVLDDVGPDQIEAYDDVNLWHADTTTPTFHYPQTPWITALAARGVRCDYAYASPVCSPTRAQILTGRYPHQHANHAGTGIGVAVNEGADAQLLASHYPFPVIISGLANTPTYTSWAVGKWHLGDGQDDPLSPTRDGGFDVYRGAMTNPNVENDDGANSGSHYNWFKTVAPADNDDGYTQTYQTDTLMATAEFEELRSFVQERETPFVACWFAHSCHSILDAIKDDAGPTGEVTTDLTSTFTEAEQSAASANLYMRRQHSHLEAVDTLAGWLDASIGENKGTSGTRIRSNTIFILVGDNGSAGGSITNATDNFWSQGTEPPANRYDTTHHKGTTYEGGIKVPLIMGGAPLVGTVAAGTNYAHPVDVVDLCPTIMDLIAGNWREYLEALGVLDEIDGISLIPLFSGGRTARQHSLSQRFTPNGATVGSEDTTRYGVVNERRWKLISTNGTEELYYIGGENGVAATYVDGSSVVADGTEQTDLIDYVDPFDVDSFSPSIWEEYNDLKTYLTSKLWTTAQRTASPPPYSAAPASPSPVIVGTEVWTVPGSAGFQPRRSMFGDSAAHVWTYNSAYPASVMMHLASASNPPTATLDSDITPGNSSVGGTNYISAAKSDDACMVYYRVPLGTGGAATYYIKYYESTGLVWTWTDPVSQYADTANYGFVSDDGSTFVQVINDQTTTAANVRTWATSSSTPVAGYPGVSAFYPLEADVSGDTDKLACQAPTLHWAMDTSDGTSLNLVFNWYPRAGPSMATSGLRYVVGYDSNFRVWNSSGGAYSLAKTHTLASGWQCVKIKISGDASTVAAVFYAGSLYTTPMMRVIVWDYASGAATLDKYVYADDGNYVTDIHISDDGTRVVAVFTGGNAGFYPTTYYWKYSGSWSGSQVLWDVGGYPTTSDLSADGTSFVVGNTGQWSSGWTTSSNTLTLVTVP